MSGDLEKMRYRLLGPVTVTGQDGSLPTRGPKQRAVLAALLLNANHVVSEEQLFDLVWGEDFPPSMRGQLQIHVSTLRKLLGSGVIRRQAHGYLMEVRPGELDLQVFTEEVANGRFAEALKLWRGPALGDTTKTLAAREGPALQELWLGALEGFFDAELAAGRHAAVLGEVQRMAGEYPFREQIQARLMLALHQAGRRTEALQVFTATRQKLISEMGIEPGQPLTQLYRRILRREEQVRRPAELPHDVRGFAGRATELATLEEHLAAGDIVIVNGTAGVGKSALAVRCATATRGRFPDGQLYVDLRGFDPAADPLSPAAALRQLLRALGAGPQHRSSDVDGLAGYFRSLLADRKILLVLDNARTAEQVYPLLPSSGPVVVTSRYRLAELTARTGARSLPLDVLPPQDSLALLAGMLGAGLVSAQAEAAAELARLCDHLPLALRIAAANIAAMPEPAIAQFNARLRYGAPLAELVLDGAEESALTVAFSLSYQALPPAHRRLFQLIGLIPGPDVTPWTVAAAARITPSQAASGLRALAAAHLIEPRAGNRYRCHALLRHYAVGRVLSA